MFVALQDGDETHVLLLYFNFGRLGLLKFYLENNVDSLFVAFYFLVVAAHLVGDLLFDALELFFDEHDLDCLFILTMAESQFFVFGEVVIKFYSVTGVVGL